MNKIFSALNLKKILLFGALFALSLFVHFLFIFEPLKGKKWLYKIYKPPLKQSLQVVEGPLIAHQNIRVLKIKRGNQIHLDFLSKQEDHSYLQINSVLLKGHKEAFFEYWGETSSLMLLDDDGDGGMEIIAPTFDKFFRPQINVVTFNKNTKKFELKNSQEIPKVVPSISR